MRLIREAKEGYLSHVTLDCEQSLFSQSSLSSAGLERAKWPIGKLERGGKKRDCILFCNRRVQFLRSPSIGELEWLINNRMLSARCHCNYDILTY